MPTRRVDTDNAAIDFTAIRVELGIPADYPADATAEAQAVADHPPTGGRDARGMAFVTIDPPGSMDLDQAVHLEAAGDGYRVHYAIADVAAFVRPGGAIDAESHRRGQTLYSPDLRTPLHPPVLSEGAASLLPDQDRPAVLWTITLDSTGEPTEVQVERAMVRSVAQLDYPGVQADADAGRLHPSIALLPEIGALRLAAARRRHAITLDLPDAEVIKGDDGHWTVSLRAVLPVEKWNAEISLLTGMSAAQMMLKGKVGLLRTLPSPSAQDIATLRKSTRAFGIPWADGVPPGDVIAGLDPSHPKEAAFLDDAVRLLRGAGYTPFQGAVPEHPEHAGVGAIYAHVTAPLRRLVDRYGTEICLALQAGTPVPAWVFADITAVTTAMSSSDRLANALEKACSGAVSAFLLTGREGEVFDGVVVQIEPDRNRAIVVLDAPPVRAHCPSAGLSEGTRIQVRLQSVDPGKHQFTVTPVGP